MGLPKSGGITPFCNVRSYSFDSDQAPVLHPDDFAWMVLLDCAQVASSYIGRSASQRMGETSDFGSLTNQALVLIRCYASDPTQIEALVSIASRIAADTAFGSSRR